jgi:hypothetical protein
MEKSASGERIQVGRRNNAPAKYAPQNQANVGTFCKSKIPYSEGRLNSLSYTVISLPSSDPPI